MGKRTKKTAKQKIAKAIQSSKPTKSKLGTKFRTGGGGAGASSDKHLVNKNVVVDSKTKSFDNNNNNTHSNKYKKKLENDIVVDSKTKSFDNNNNNKKNGVNDKKKKQPIRKKQNHSRKQVSRLLQSWSETTSNRPTKPPTQPNTNTNKKTATNEFNTEYQSLRERTSRATQKSTEIAHRKRHGLDTTAGLFNMAAPTFKLVEQMTREEQIESVANSLGGSSIAMMDANPFSTANQMQQSSPSHLPQLPPPPPFNTPKSVKSQVSNKFALLEDDDSDDDMTEKTVPVQHPFSFAQPSFQSGIPFDHDPDL
eukprot:CAMPEP_0194394574 /NCGR_PEP_ID=MMETSP0174-20130528/123929_1 /TAXON_ID=216777 /ORGANISM="Proboscia alata, Strain PI-D3" /LENGTH=309 /DNA_ID=CAMNT_0039190385 /DNA_START=136 /DNA_END=1065 /DNA_ORIENTATION=+